MSEYYCRNLPMRLTYDMFNENLAQYIKALYNIFKKDFIDNKPSFQGKPVDIIHEQFFQGKERSFWHIISSGQEDVTRELDSDRCSRLPWVRPFIDENGSCDNYRFWIKWFDKTKKDRYYIWCTAVNYMVILEDRNTHFKLITAYKVMNYNVNRYMKEYISFIKTKTPT